MIALANSGSSVRASAVSRASTLPTAADAAPNAVSSSRSRRWPFGVTSSFCPGSRMRNGGVVVRVRRLIVAPQSSSLTTRAMGTPPTASIAGSAAGARDIVSPAASNAASAGSCPSSSTRNPRRASSAPATSPLVAPPQTTTS